MAGQTVIPASELLRIRSSLLERDDAPGAKKGTGPTALELHERSKARASTWTNTLEGSRRKKHEDKKKQFEKEELARQEVDAKEAAILNDKRRHAIERANKILYDESDRMKTFHSKMMLCDVLAEREAQVALKEELGKLEGIREERYLEMEKASYRNMLERELREKDSLGKAAHMAAAMQKQQLADATTKRLRQIEDDVLEGEMLRQKAAEDLRAERLAEKKRRQQAVQALAETQKANAYLKQLRAEDEMREQREEEKIREYANRKERVLELRKKREAEVFNAKQAHKQRMIDEQGARLASMKSNEDERLERQVLEKEMKDEMIRLEKEERSRKWLDEIDTSRRMQVERKRAQMDREKAEEHELSCFWKEWCGRLDELDEQEHTQRRLAAKKLAQEQLMQAEVRKRREEEEKRREQTVAVSAQAALEADTLEFHAYAEEQIKGYASEGKNIIPLIKELRSFRKRVLE
jgi:hypothetical protein